MLEMFNLNKNVFFNSTFKLIFFIGVVVCHQRSHRGRGFRDNEIQPIRRYTNGLPMRYPNPYSPDFPDRFLNQYPWRYAQGEGESKGCRRSDKFLEESRRLDPQNDFERVYRRHLLRDRIRNYASVKKQLDFKKTEDPIDITGVTLSKNRFTKDDPGGNSDDDSGGEEPEGKTDSEDEEPVEEYEKGEEPAEEKPKKKKHKKKPKKRPSTDYDYEEEPPEPAKDKSKPKGGGPGNPNSPSTPDMPKSPWGTPYKAPGSYFPKNVHKSSPWAYQYRGGKGRSDSQPEQPKDRPPPKAETPSPSDDYWR